MKAKLILLLALFTVGSLIHADVRLPNVLSNHMVLQRDLQVPVWGWADAGEKNHRFLCRAEKSKPPRTKRAIG